MYFNILWIGLITAAPQPRKVEVEGRRGGCIEERIERFIEGQAFLRSYDSAPCSPPPPYPVSELDFR
jgi:hypothetical protein